MPGPVKQPVMPGPRADEAAEHVHHALEGLAAVEIRLTALEHFGAGSARQSARIAEIRTMVAAVRADLMELARMDGAGGSSLRMDSLERLDWLCDAFYAQSGIDCRLEVRPEHARLDPVSADVLHRTIRELFVLYKRAQTRRIVITSELRDDGSVAFHVSFGSDAERRVSPVESNSVALWDIDQRLREVGAYLEIRTEPGICTSVVFPRQLIIFR
jgi:hypothetical protein